MTEKLTQLNHIADMIRANDEAAHHYINMLVYCVSKNINQRSMCQVMDGTYVDMSTSKSSLGKIPNYIQSIDDQDAIMPEGDFTVVKRKGKFMFVGFPEPENSAEIMTPMMPKEPQARLLAIVLVWIWLEEQKS